MRDEAKAEKELAAAEAEEKRLRSMREKAEGAIEKAENILDKAEKRAEALQKKADATDDPQEKLDILKEQLKVKKSMLSVIRQRDKVQGTASSVKSQLAQAERQTALARRKLEYASKATGVVSRQQRAIPGQTGQSSGSTSRQTLSGLFRAPQQPFASGQPQTGSSNGLGTSARSATPPSKSASIDSDGRQSAYNYKKKWKFEKYLDPMEATCRLAIDYIFEKSDAYRKAFITIGYRSLYNDKLHIKLYLDKNDIFQYKNDISYMLLRFEDGSNYKFPVHIMTLYDQDGSKDDIVLGDLPHGGAMNNILSKNSFSMSVPGVFDLQHHLKSTSNLVPKLLSCARSNGADDLLFARYNPQNEIERTSDEAEVTGGNVPMDPFGQSGVPGSAAAEENSAQAVELENEIDALEKGLNELEGMTEEQGNSRESEVLSGDNSPVVLSMDIEAMPDLQVTSARNPNVDFIFGDGRISKAGGDAFLYIGNLVSISKLKMLFPGFKVSYEDYCEGEPCYSVSSGSSAVQITVDERHLANSVILWGKGGSDSLGNASDDSLIAATGSNKLQCDSGMMVMCRSPQISGLTYITGEGGDCQMSPRDDIAKTTVPTCAKIDGFILTKGLTELEGMTEEQGNSRASEVPSDNNSPEVLSMDIEAMSDLQVCAVGTTKVGGVSRIKATHPQLNDLKAAMSYRGITMEICDELLEIDDKSVESIMDRIKKISNQ